MPIYIFERFPLLNVCASASVGKIHKSIYCLKENDFLKNYSECNIVAL